MMRLSRDNKICHPALILTAMLSVILLGQHAPAYAQAPVNNDELNLDAIYKCAEISDETDRLGCYDGAVGRLKSAEESGDLVTISRQEVEDIEKDAFGFSLSSLPRLFSRAQNQDSKVEDIKAEDSELKTDDLTAPVITADNAPTETRKAPSTRKEIQAEEEIYRINTIEQPLRRVVEFSFEKKRFFLANGQVWDQVTADDLRIPRERDGKTNNVEIRRGALGSFLLRVNGKGKAVPVRRRR